MTIDHAMLQPFLVDETLWVCAARTGVAVYDFQFEHFLPCRHFGLPPTGITAVARIGAFNDYQTFFDSAYASGIRLIHSPEEHSRCSQLPGWYPLIEDVTPKSIWFDKPPDPQLVESVLKWPIFVKGIRQTSHHQRQFAIIPNAAEFRRAMETYQRDPILGWQPVVCREFVRLRLVDDPLPDRIPSSFEFRTFFWKGQLVGYGRYWWEGKPYQLTEQERGAALAVAQRAAARIAVPFLVVDVAQAADGQWLVIECNDGQESGYAGASPLGIWQNVLLIERGETISR